MTESEGGSVKAQGQQLAANGVYGRQALAGRAVDGGGGGWLGGRRDCCCECGGSSFA